MRQAIVLPGKRGGRRARVKAGKVHASSDGLIHDRPRVTLFDANGRTGEGGCG